MTNRFDIIRQYWPDRGIFQGAATAYMQYSKLPRRQWIYLEKPLWKHVLSFFPKTTRMLDFGAGTGKLTWAAIEEHQIPRRITSFEPNPILQHELQRELPPVRAIRRSNKTLSKSSWAQNGFSLIVANMVVNHLDGRSFNNFIDQNKCMLGSTGTLIYTIPHPVHEATELRIPHDVDETKREVPAPWGGYTEYHHRSVGHQINTLINQGFHVGLIEWGYEDTLHGYQIEPYEENADHDLRGPRRLMIIARKNRSIPERMLIPPSIRPTSLPPYSLQEEFGETPGISMRMQESNLQEARRRFASELNLH